MRRGWYLEQVHAGNRGTYERASFWFMRTDELLVKRSAMLRAL
jgi:hypothetical protein